MPRLTDKQGRIRCQWCNRWLPTDQFYKAPPSQRTDYSAYCKECNSEVTFVKLQRRKLKTEGSEAFIQSIKEDERRLKIKKKILAEAQHESP